MIERPFWIERILAAWRKRPVVWLSGVRRTGKTTLARMIPEAVVLNCDLPSVVRRLEDPELFFGGQDRDARIVLDEVHRLPDPSRTLKIAADAFPRLRVLATGSSTLAATMKFRDSLTGRKASVFLPPVLWTECEQAFGIRDLDRRLLRGGLPEALLGSERDATFYAEWMDGFYARDVQELFGVRDRTGFLNLFRLMLLQSGGLADYSALSRECDLSRPTVKAYLEAMSIAHALHSVPPFHGGGRSEILKRPKVYGFDTGFVAFARGWNDIRDEDRGILWEHLVLDVLHAATGGEGLHYWRDKSGREVDFVVKKGREVVAVECKVNPDRFDPSSLLVFRDLVPKGRDYLVCPGIEKPYGRRIGGRTVRAIGCAGLLRELGSS
jgi:uncharacterized protein